MGRSLFLWGSRSRSQVKELGVGWGTLRRKEASSLHFPPSAVGQEVPGSARADTQWMVA